MVLTSVRTVVQPCRIHCTLDNSFQGENGVNVVSCLFSGDDAILPGDLRTKPVNQK